MRVLVVGGASWGHRRAPRPPSDGRAASVFATRSYEAPGGTGAGKALNLAALGHEVHLHTLLGDDASGRRVETELANAGVHLHTDPDAGPTEQHVNLMAADGWRRSVYRSVITPRPDLELTRIVGLAADCDAVVLNITDYVRRLVAPLRERGIPFWTDLHDWDGRNPYHRDVADAAASVVLATRPSPTRCR